MSFFVQVNVKLMIYWTDFVSWSAWSGLALLSTKVTWKPEFHFGLNWLWNYTCFVPNIWGRNMTLICGRWSYNLVNFLQNTHQRQLIVHLRGLFVVSKPINSWKCTWVRTQHCDYWCHGAKAPGHQYPQCWLNNHCTGPVSYLNIAVVYHNITK